MKLFAIIENFRNDESGAVTVDWVVLTAAIVGLGIAVVASVRSGTEAVATQIDTNLTAGANTVGTPNFTTGGGGGGGD